MLDFNTRAKSYKPHNISTCLFFCTSNVVVYALNKTTRDVHNKIYIRHNQ